MLEEQGRKGRVVIDVAAADFFLELSLLLLRLVLALAVHDFAAAAATAGAAAAAGAGVLVAAVVRIIKGVEGRHEHKRHRIVSP